MEELLIEEKNYVSSKRAAKITGYAKDYIGQLCREGRVPARLVGRSWYVLESAIQDHRFGDPESEEKSVEQAKEPVPTSLPTWEAPRYEAVKPYTLPSVNRLREQEGALLTEEAEKIVEVPCHLQDSWQAWFEHTAGVAEAVAEIEESASEVSQDAEIEEERVEVAEIVDEQPEIVTMIEEHEDAEEAVNVPIRAIQHHALECVSRREEVVTVEEEQEQPVAGTGNVLRAVQMIGACVATVMVGLAIIGSGYFDTYIVSVSQVQMASGASVYNR